MKTIQLIHKLSELGRLVEIWENPFTVTSYPFHWEDYTEEEFNKLPDDEKYYHRDGVEIRRQKYVQDVPVEFTEMHNSKGKVLTQAAFEAEVRKVSEEIINIIQPKICKRKNFILEYEKYSFDELFNEFEYARLSVSKYNTHAEIYIHTICYKMGVELEASNE